MHLAKTKGLHMKHWVSHDAAQFIKVRIMFEIKMLPNGDDRIHI